MAKSLIIELNDMINIIAISNSKRKLCDIMSKIDNFINLNITIKPTIIYKIERVPSSEDTRYLDSIMCKDILDEPYFKLNMGLCYSFTRLTYSQRPRNTELKGIQLNFNDITLIILGYADNRVYEEFEFLHVCSISNGSVQENTDYSQNGIIEA